jgi:hypothetical protein
MTHRLIDASIHDLSGPQILETMLRMFKQDTSEPVVLLTVKGRGLHTVKILRSELTRLRSMKAKAGQTVSLFGFEAIPFGDFKLDGVVKESYALKFRMTQLQMMRNLANSCEVDL